MDEDKNKKELEGVKRYIRGKLKKQGLYRPELGYQIELTARNLLLYRRLSDECMSLGGARVTEYGGEGSPRVRVSPLFDAVKKQAEIVRRDLTVLWMNRGLKKNLEEGDDGTACLSALFDAMKEEGDAGGACEDAGGGAGARRGAPTGSPTGEGGAA